MKTSVALTMASLLTVSLLQAQAPVSNTRVSSYSAPRTPWGDPDLQGTYTNSNESGTPMARPPELGDRKPEDVTPEEMARLAKERAARIEKTAETIGGTEDNNTGAGPSHWYENYNPKNSRPWMVLDGPDYQVPPITQEAKDRAAALRAARGGGDGYYVGPFRGPEEFTPYVRCITRGVPGSMMPAIYGNSYDITQSPGFVAIRYEMVHDTRVIPLDRRPQVNDTIKSYVGDAIVAGLVGTYARMDRFDEAKTVAEKAIADKLDAPGIHLNLLRIAFIENDRAAIDRETRWFAGRPDEYISVTAQAVNALTLGQRRKAVQLLEQAAGMAKRRGLPAGGTLSPIDDALLGNCPAAGSPAATNPNPLVLVLCADAASALKFADEATRRPLMASGWVALQLPMIRAAAELKRNDPEAALELLKPVAPHDLWAPQAPYLRGLAYLAVRKGAEAASEFQRVIDHRGIHWQFQPVFPRETGPLRAISYVGLARGAALAGDTVRARKAYQDFLALWKDADPEIPIFIEARKEYAALN